MEPSTLFWHLLHFVAPAFAVALWLVLCSHIFMRQLAKPQGWLLPVVINFVVGCLVLASGLILLGDDGRMHTYAALALGCASSQWLLLRSWRESGQN